MRIQLAKTLEGIGFYGPIYDLDTGLPDKVEEYIMDYGEHDWLLDHMIDKINETCDTMLDDGDYDYISCEKCSKLVDLIESLPDGFVPCEYKKVMFTLKEFAIRAIEYNTGIAIEM